jgi:MoaA/NifB/PqqE/SkfB family radical SAM enzyme
MAGFTTNATLLDRPRTLELIQSGLDIIAVSLAGVTPATHERLRPGCDLRRIDAALTELKELKREYGVQSPRVHIAFMLLRSNWRDVDGLVELAARWAATQVVVSNLTWIAGEAFQRESLLVNSELWPEVAGVLIRARQAAAETGIELSYSGPGNGRPRAMCAENVLNACFVSYRGDVSPCVFTSPSVSRGKRAVYYFKEREHELRPLVFGNVSERPLPEIWDSEPAREFRESFQYRLVKANPGMDRLPEPCTRCYKLLET